MRRIDGLLNSSSIVCTFNVALTRLQSCWEWAINSMLRTGQAQSMGGGPLKQRHQ